MPGYRQALQIAAKLSVPMTLVIDPGHGGPDSGAVASDGTVEKNINLAISLALKQEAEKYGIKVVLTRDSDAGLYGEDNTSGRWLKLGDLKERKRIIDEAAPDLMISIHLNSFQQDSKVKGSAGFLSKEWNGRGKRGKQEHGGEDSEVFDGRNRRWNGSNRPTQKRYLPV